MFRRELCPGVQGLLQVVVLEWLHARGPLTGTCMLRTAVHLCRRLEFLCHCISMIGPMDSDLTGVRCLSSRLLLDCGSAFPNATPEQKKSC